MNNMSMLLIWVIAIVMISTLIIAVWVYKDAKQRGLNGVLWALLVLVIGNFGGLILYLLVGRTQNNVICNNCNSKTSGNGGFCSMCGEKIEAKEKSVRSYKGLLIACVVFVCIAIISIVGLVFTYFNASGFQFERRYMGYRTGPDGYMKDLNEKSSGDTWELSFDESSEDYTIKKFYNAKEEPELLTAYATSSNNGIAVITVSQGDKSKKAVIEMVGTDIDLSDFEEGKLEVEVRNVNAEDFNCTIIIK